MLPLRRIHAFAPHAVWLHVMGKSRARSFSFLQMFYKEKKMRSWPVLIFQKENSGDCFNLVADSDEERLITILIVGILPTENNTTQIQLRQF
jgi:hypothetical protein